MKLERIERGKFGILSQHKGEKYKKALTNLERLPKRDLAALALRECLRAERAEERLAAHQDRFLCVAEVWAERERQMKHEAERQKLEFSNKLREVNKEAKAAQNTVRQLRELDTPLSMERLMEIVAKKQLQVIRRKIRSASRKGENRCTFPADTVCTLALHGLVDEGFSLFEGEVSRAEHFGQWQESIVIVEWGEHPTRGGEEPLSLPPIERKWRRE